MASYDVSSNPSVVEGERMKSVKKNSPTLVEEWWYWSSGRAQDLNVANEWSTGHLAPQTHPNLWERVRTKRGSL